MRISIQGIKGAFHEEAARHHFSSEIDIVENLTFHDLVKSVSSGEAEMGIMAIENTISGTIHSNFELIKASALNVVGEVYMAIEQNLAVKRGVKMEALRKVESHYMAIDQCRAYFSDKPHIQLVDTADTAISLKRVAEEQLEDTGAIGSALAAQYYDLEIIGKGIQTDKKNYTRFLLLKKGTLAHSPHDKATVQLTLIDGKGALSVILGIIYRHDIDITKIESLPIVGEPWHYQFYIDLMYDRQSDFEAMSREVEPLLEEFSVLGRYESWRKKNGL